MLTYKYTNNIRAIKTTSKKRGHGLLRRIRRRIKERIGMKKIFDYITLLQKYNTLKKPL